MSGGINGPLIYDGTAYSFKVKTLLQLRQSLMIRLGYAAQLAAPPPGMDELLNDFLIDAQEQMYERFSPLRNQIWWRINVTQGNRNYDIPSISTGELTDVAFNNNDPLVDDVTRVAGSFITDGFTPGMVVSISGSPLNGDTSFVVAAVEALKLTTTTAGSFTTEAAGAAVTLNTITYKALDMRRISEQWVVDGSTWNKMREGINVNRFNETGQGYPQDYEWTDHLEIWPEPDKAYVIYVKGHFGLLPFTADTDVTTIDHKLIFLMALANAKTHYGQKDAGTYYRQLEVFLSKLNKGTFGNKRFIPVGNNGTVINKEEVLNKPVGTWR
jgi:hypothetical protein